MSKENISTYQLIIRVGIAWLFYVCLYVFSRDVLNFDTFSACFLLAGEAGLDVIVVMLIFRLWKKSKEKFVKNILLVFLISFICSFVADFIYNIVLNLFNFQYIDPWIVFFFDFPFMLFLIFQLVGWGVILFGNKDITTETRRYSYIPYVFIAFLMFFMFMFGTAWRIEYFSIVGVFQVLDTILEVMGFALVSICLGRAKTTPIRYIGIGYLIIVSSDFVIRYHIISGVIPYLSPLETTWTLGLLLIYLGFFVIDKNKSDESFRLLTGDSLQSQIALWLLILWLFSVLCYITLCCVFSKNKGDDFTYAAQNCLSLLVPFSALVIVSSSYLSKKISSSLSRLEDSINNFIYLDKVSISNFNQIETMQDYQPKGDEKKFELYEVEKLRGFIIDTINQLRLANRIKSEFLMNMSHDFRTPASGIYHMSRTIYKNLENKELKNLQKMVVDSSEQLMQYLEDILDFTKLENNKFELHLEEIDINEVVHEVIRFFQPKAEEKMLIINSILSPVSIYYKGDRLMIHRILLNLISNAIKFTHHGGVTISALREERENKWLVIQIKDTGIGIEESHHEIIFEPFTCLAPAETSKYSGIGLGLSHVFLMLKRMGGKIILESGLNQGSTFSVFLPIESI